MVYKLRYVTEPRVHMRIIMQYFFFFFKGKTVGEFAKDKFPGEFMDGWRNSLKGEGFVKVAHIVFVVS